MNSLAMIHSEKNKMFKLCRKIIQEFGNLCKELIQQQNGMTPQTVIDATASYFSNELDRFLTRYKREQKIKKNPFYVPPEERTVGTRVEMRYDEREQIEKPLMIHSTLQYVPMISTLIAFFKRQENLEMYLNFQVEHQCDDSIIKQFCCGKLYRSQEFFRLNPSAIQIQIAIDDMEICDPLSSKSGLHKVCAVYFTIANIPVKFKSKLNNIFLLCLCNSDDLKTKKTDINNIWEMIVSELKYLEEVGIVLDDGQVLKGTLIRLVGDNLGLNGSLCMNESFRSTYFCRICKLSNEKCQQETMDNLNVYRDEMHYDEMLNIIQNSEKVEFKETCGIKRYCVLNDLKYFHTFRNFSLDFMHDFLEGLMSFSLKHVFRNLIDNKVFKEDDLKKMIQFYQYPKHFRRDKPSALNFKKSNLGQNAAQMKCLFLNIPFILKEYEKNIHLANMWSCLKSLLRAFQIVNSETFDDALLIELETCVDKHLKSVMELFKVKLIPKHHLLIHYANIIRIMGPLFDSSMMRFEAKHTFFKTASRNTNNFININKTLAMKHQLELALNKNTFCDKVSHKKPKEILFHFMRTTFGDSITSHIPRDSGCLEVGSFNFNSYVYERKSVVSFDMNLYEIELIVLKNPNYFFVATKLDILEFNEFTQSLEVRKLSTPSYVFIAFDEMSHRKSYCSKFLEGNQFVIIDNNDILRSVNE